MTDAPENITAVQRVELDGKPWQIDVSFGGETKSHLIDSAAELNRIFLLPRGFASDQRKHDD